MEQKEGFSVVTLLDGHDYLNLREKEKMEKTLREIFKEGNKKP